MFTQKLSEFVHFIVTPRRFFASVDGPTVLTFYDVFNFCPFWSLKGRHSPATTTEERETEKKKKMLNTSTTHPPLRVYSFVVYLRN